MRRRGRAPAGSPRARVVVAGLGDTGILVAGRLARRFDVTAVTTRPALVSGQELGGRVSDPDYWRRYYLIPHARYHRLDEVRVVHGRVAGVDLDQRTVQVEPADGEAESLPYDALVIATGVTNGFWRHDRVEDLDTVEADITETATTLAAASSIAVIGGGATGVSAAENLARRHPHKDVHLFFPGDEPLPGYHRGTRVRIVRHLERAGVHVHPGHRAAVPAGFAADRVTGEAVEWSTGQEPFEADAVLWTVGQVRPHTGFLPPQVLDADGFVRVDEHLQVPGHPEVFAVGDVAASDPHRSSARNWGFRVVTANVEAVLDGKVGALERFKAPAHRWGSITGLHEEGLTVFQPNGKAFRVPRWAAEPLLYRAYTRLFLHGALRPDRAPRSTPRR